MMTTIDAVRRERKTEAAVRALDVSDLVGWIHELQDGLDRLNAEAELKNRLIEGVYSFLCELEVEPDEDSCMGMAFVTGRVSEDEYCSLKKQTLARGEQ